MNFIFAVCLQKVSVKCSFWSCLILAHLVAHKISDWLIYLQKHLRYDCSKVVQLSSYIYSVLTPVSIVLYQANIVLHDQYHHRLSIVNSVHAKHRYCCTCTLYLLED